MPTLDTPVQRLPSSPVDSPVEALASPVNSDADHAELCVVRATMTLLRHATECQEARLQRLDDSFSQLSRQAHQALMQDQRRQMHPAFRLPATADSPENSTGKPCLLNQRTLRIPPAHNGADPAPSPGRLLHGHTELFVHLPEDSPVHDLKYNRLSVAQSPDMLALNPLRPTPAIEWLQQALRTGKKDFFQIVSRDSHANGRNDPEVPLLTQYSDALANADSALGVPIADGWYLASISADSPEAGVRVASLHLQQPETRDNRTIRLTQAAPAFTEGLLNPDDLLNLHALYRNRVENPDRSVIFSYSGGGRSGALAVFHQLSNAIEAGMVTDEAGLERALHDLTLSGKRVRGEHFVSNNDQYAAIWEAASRALDRRLG